MPLRQQRALITGAGQGLGKAIAWRLARAGAEVIVTDRAPERVAAVVAELRAANLSAFGYVFDVTSAEQVALVRSQLHAERGPISLLINNAGVVFGGDFLTVPIERHQTTVAVNLTGLLIATHVFLPDLIANAHGSVVNIASAAALVPLPSATSYASSKAGVLAFSESLREELRWQGHRHVHVGTVCPSYISTGLFDGAKPAYLTWLLPPEAVADAVLKMIIRKRPTMLLPWTVALLHAGARLLPAPLYRRLCRRLGVTTSMTYWHGHS